MSNVISLSNSSIQDGKPVEEVVTLLEEMLAKAKDGKVIGLAMVVAESGPQVFETAIFGSEGTRHTLSAGILSLAFQFGRAMSGAT